MLLLTSPDLTPTEVRLTKLVAEGESLDLTSGRKTEDDPASGSRWGRARQIRSQVLIQLLTGLGDLDAAFGPPRKVHIRGARLTGPLLFRSAELRCQLVLDGCHVGHVDLTKARAPDLALQSSYLEGAFLARRLHVADDLRLAGSTCAGLVDLTGARVGGALDLEAVTVSNGGERAVVADLLDVEGDAVFHAARVTGGIGLRGAHIRGVLTFNDAVLADSDGDALDADLLAVDGGLFMRDAHVQGQIRLPRAHIRGVLACEKAEFNNQGGTTLNVDGASIDGDVVLREARVQGAIRLLGAQIRGDLSAIGAALASVTGTEPAVTADHLHLEGNVFFLDARVNGETRMLSAHVGGQIACERAHLANGGGRALNADELTVAGGLWLRDVQVEGEVRLIGSRIGGQLNCDGANFDNAGALSLNLARATINGPVYMTPAALTGGLDLSFARVAAWYDDAATWPVQLVLAGFKYDAIDASDVTVHDRLRWIGRNTGAYSPQPYEQLAYVYRQAGDEGAARSVMISKQRARRACSSRGAAGWLSRAWSHFLRWTIGYGYRPAFVLPWFLALLVVGSSVLGVAHPKHLAPVDESDATTFHAVAYTLDLLLPVANLDQRDAFVAQDFAYWWVLGLTLSGWLLAVVVVAGLGGVFKRD